MPSTVTQARRRGSIAPLGVMVILLSGLAVLGAGLGFAKPPSERASPAARAPDYVSAAACAGCHQAAFEAWRGSHHDWALRPPTPESMLGDFDDAIHELHGVRTRFFKRDGKYLVETEGADGKPATFEVKYAVGVAPLQQYLIELDGGRLQALDLAWDVEGKRWFHLYPARKIKAGDGLHWTGTYKNWNSRCAECHSTNYVKGYDARDRSYHSTWSDMNVACEACHGPGEAHVAWAKAPDGFAKERFSGVDDRGLAVVFDPAKPETEIQLCAPCHSRRQALDAKSPLPGEGFSDNYRLALLRQGLYHADGQIDDEVYVYGSFLQSKMHARGVRCSDCHEPHEATLKAEGDAVCTQCHSPAGNARFPTLRKAAYDTPEHHHHPPDSDGARCVGCHMPQKSYMVVDPRRDHSFRVPRPDLSDKLGTPNACTGCHQDKSAAWAADQVRAWYPNGRSGTPHFGEVLHRGRTKGDTATRDALMALALDTTKPEIVRATALSLLRGRMTPETVERLRPLGRDPGPLVRAAAVRVVEGLPRPLRDATARPLLGDPVRTVRLAAMDQLLDLDPRTLSKQDRDLFEKVLREHQQALSANADFPETHMRIAGIAMVLRNLPAAERALRTAISLDPQLTDAWLMLARIQTATRRLKQARATLTEAIARTGSSAILQRSLGNVLASLGDTAAAEKALTAARALAPDDVGIRLELAALQTRARRHGEAIATLTDLLARAPDHAQGLELLALNQLAAGDLVTARDTVRRLRQRHPGRRLNQRLRALERLAR